MIAHTHNTGQDKGGDHTDNSRNCLQHDEYSQHCHYGLSLFCTDYGRWMMGLSDGGGGRGLRCCRKSCVFVFVWWCVCGGTASGSEGLYLVHPESGTCEGMCNCNLCVSSVNYYAE